MKKKILFYNWCPFDVGLGGGVSVYIRNLLEYIINDNKYDVYFLSSGYKYNPFTKKTYIQKLKTVLGDACHSYEIINSDVLGPIGNLRYSLKNFIEGTKAVDTARNFIKKQGPFDIIHIQNIGGIGQEFLNLKEDFPETKFIFDLHNYNSFCMNSYLFQHNNSSVCENIENGLACERCFENIKLSASLYENRIKAFCRENWLLYTLYKILKPLKVFKNSYNKYYSLNKISNTHKTAYYEIYRNKNIEYLNKNFDKIIAVSERVKDIAVKYGLNENKTQVSYIGTKFAENPLPPKTYNKNGNIKIAYMGYANVLKGFYFLIEALSTIPENFKKRIDIVLAAKNADKEEVNNLLTGFNSIKIVDGYTHDSINNILSDVDLGIVPVLWEDNLPQVAIEMVSNGVPILCSDLGGASELSKSTIFKFRGADKENFKEKLINIIINPNLLQEYWQHHIGLTTMDKNFKDLNSIYEEF